SVTLLCFTSIRRRPAGPGTGARGNPYGGHTFLSLNPAPRILLLSALAKPQQEISMSGDIINVTDASFDDDVLKSDTPVLVDYWAAWCGPCKMIAPILDDVAKEYAGKLKIAKVNIDENPETPRKYGVRGIPTLTVFKNGAVEATKVGALSKSQLTAFLDSTL